jgi:hypothetical protein
MLLSISEDIMAKKKSAKKMTKVKKIAKKKNTIVVGGL